MCRIRGKGLADHHATLGPRIRVLQRGDARDDRPVPVEWLINVVERVDIALDVGPGGLHRENVV
jgi:hypothetical protein